MTGLNYDADDNIVGPYYMVCVETERGEFEPYLTNTDDQPQSEANAMVLYSSIMDDPPEDRPEGLCVVKVTGRFIDCERGDIVAGGRD